MSDDGDLKEDLIDLPSNLAFEMQFESKTFERYWCYFSAVVMLPRLCETALSVLIPFAEIRLRELGFNTLLSVQMKSRNRLNAQADISVSMSNIIPRFKKLVSKTQKQMSH